MQTVGVCWIYMAEKMRRRMGDRLAGGPKFGVQVHFNVF